MMQNIDHQVGGLVRIGLDFDNAIICSDQVFAAVAPQRVEQVPEGWEG